NEKQDQHRQCDSYDAQIILDAAILKARHQATALANPTATFIEAEVHHIFVEDPADPGKAEHQIGDQLNRAVPNPVIEPIASPGPPGIQPNDRVFVNFIDVIFVAKKAKNVGSNLLKDVQFGTRCRSAAIQPPRETNAQKNNGA